MMGIETQRTEDARENVREDGYSETLTSANQCQLTSYPWQQPRGTSRTEGTTKHENADPLTDAGPIDASRRQKTYAIPSENDDLSKNLSPNDQRTMTRQTGLPSGDKATGEDIGQTYVPQLGTGVDRNTEEADNAVLVSKLRPVALTDTDEESGERVAGDARDGGYGWVILVATFFNYIIVAAIWGSFPLLYIEYADNFNESLAKTGVIASVEAAMLHFTAAVGSGLVEKYGSRPVAIVGSIIATVCLFGGSFAESITHLCVCYGLAGCGIGLSYVSFVVIIQQWFDKKRTIASGFSLTGFSVAAFSVPPLTQLLLDEYGWRGTLMIFSGVYLNGVVMAALLKPVPTNVKPPSHRRGRSLSFSQQLRRQVSIEKATTTATKIYRFCRQIFDFSMFKNLGFNLYGIGTFLMMIGHVAFTTHIVSKAERYLGIEKHKAMLLPSIYGISNGVCRMLFSLLASIPRINRTVQYAAWIIAGGIVCCLSCLATDFMSLAIACSGFGMCVGSYISIQHPALVDLLGLEQIVRSAGLLQIFIGSAGLIATPLAGWLYDITGDYNIPYYVIGVLKILGGCVILTIPIFQRKPKSAMCDSDDSSEDGEFGSLEQRASEQFLNETRIERKEFLFVPPSMNRNADHTSFHVTKSPQSFGWYFYNIPMYTQCKM